MESIQQIIINSTIMLVEITQEKSTPRHTHGFFELAYIVNGTSRHNINDQIIRLKPGDYFFVDYDTPHDYVSQEGITIINCLFQPELVNKTLAGVKNFNELARRYFFHITGQAIKGSVSNRIFHDGNRIIQDLLHQMQKEYELQTDGYMEILRCLLCQIIIHSIRQVGSVSKGSELTRYLLDEIEQRFSEPLNLEHLCLQHHYRLPYASSKFKEDTGLTFTQMLQSRRIEESCLLLIETKQSIAQISEQVGYSDVKFFNRIFKRFTKMTPREYRKQNTFPANRFTLI